MSLWYVPSDHIFGIRVDNDDLICLADWIHKRPSDFLVDKLENEVIHMRSIDCHGF